MKRQLWKNAFVVALSAVVFGGTAAFGGCKGGDDYKLTVSIFCNDQDAATNKAICLKWAEEYSKKLVENGTFEEGQKIEIGFSSLDNSETYFSILTNSIASNSAPDVFYISPKYVKVWAKLGRVLDLTEYFEKTEEMAATLSDVWEDSLGFYGYSPDEGYTQGERISYDATTGTFQTQSGIRTGLYGLPKDYSNFGLGFNNRFFSEEMRRDYTQHRATDARGVTGAEYETAAIAERGGERESGVVTYACNGDGFRAGDDAPLINIGVPTTYKPYNFYRFANYRDAVAGNDPMALSVEKFTGGKGYTVTIPGFPGDSFEMPEDKRAQNVPYDASKGYVTYTFAEYGALTWAVTYYLNTFHWDGEGNVPDGTGNDLEGYGGMTNAIGQRKNVYGNDQYDGVLYLLPWLAGNDANYINQASDSVVNGSDPKAVGTEKETVKKPDITGTLADREIEYGVNSANFIETYGAFLSYGSDWNGNSNNAGDTTGTKLSGWDLFCAGACVFYGAGTWDASTRNQSQYRYLQFRQTTEPVGEKYALYSEVKNADYEMQRYGGSCRPYTQAEIVANQAERQDKWGARMDSVGYGVNGNLKKLEGAAAWKAAGAAALVRELTINPDVQRTLTYSGAQLPNFKSQCMEFLDYQSERYAQDGTFCDMVTPDGSATVTGEAGKALWNEYLDLAEKLYAARTAAGAKNTTIRTWMAENASDKSYDEAFANDPVSSVTDRSYAMKALCMTTYTKADRDLSLRMQSGLNSVRDSSMYTYEDAWLSKLEGRGNNFLMAYSNQARLTSAEQLDEIVKDPSTAETNNRFATPRWFCLTRAASAQKELQHSIENEKLAMG